jgi:hypothetical protein
MLEVTTAKPYAETLRQWLTRQLSQVPDGSATAKAIKPCRAQKEKAPTLSRVSGLFA